MQYQVDNLKVRVDTTLTLREIIAKKYRINNFKFAILKRSIDARNKEDVCYVYRLLIETPSKLKFPTYLKQQTELDYPQWQNSKSPIIVGFGPSGMFAALYLARCGARPIIIERGGKIEKRLLDVDNFMKKKILNCNSNVQFGEGGAGTFSDGKLNTNVKNPLINFILSEFYKHGAQEEILYDAMPHIGTDILQKVVKNIRLEIESLGGQFYFDTTFMAVNKTSDGLLCMTTGGSFLTEHLILGIGHSAKDTIEYLYSDLGLKMEPKAFSLGVRIEHLALQINQAQYGHFACYLPPAYYKLAHHANNRGIYTFCMCPGGYVLASASNPNSIVTNGMSNSMREGINSNSAILVDVRPQDFQNDILCGLKFQDKYEKLAYELGGNYKAPANLVKEFLADQVASSFRSVKPSYPHSVNLVDISKCLPDFVVEGLKIGLVEFDKKLAGFACPDAILTAVESRSSSVVRILRDETRQASLKGIYPIGEGAGHAGGITSSALDGLLTAISIVK